VPAGPTAAGEAEKVRRRLVNQVDEQRNPRTRARVNQLMERYLELLDVEEPTRERYEQSSAPSSATFRSPDWMA
jgi:hypothetical protein